jgi:hypothetical protein
VRKDYLQTAVWVELRHSLLPAGKLSSHLLRVFSVKEKTIRKLKELSVERDFGQHAAV